jgi:mRNA interferase RelE/StbE
MIRKAFPYTTFMVDRSNEMKGKIKSDFSEAITMIQNCFAMIPDDEKLSPNEFKSIEKSIDELKADRIRIFYSYKNAKRFLNGDILYKPQARPIISSVAGAALISIKSPEWFIGMSDSFIKNTRNIDAKIRGRILQAIANIMKAPIKKKGNTVKPLVGEMKGLWRYRFGDFRIIYQPDISTKHILLLAFDSRGSVYA